jgi:hypothetical protein
MSFTHGSWSRSHAASSGKIWLTMYWLALPRAVSGPPASGHSVRGDRAASQKSAVSNWSVVVGVEARHCDCLVRRRTAFIRWPSSPTFTTCWPSV